LAQIELIAKREADELRGWPCEKNYAKGGELVFEPYCGRLGISRFQTLDCSA
jgi:hypothetical protein